MLQPLTVIAGIFAVLFLLFFGATVATVRKRHYFRGVEYLLLAFLMISLSALFGTTMVSVRGYQALTHEEVAAVLHIQPRGEQRFVVQVRFPDGTTEQYQLVGDEVYVDARILKWNPIVNILGLHTAYELDRIGGRYRDVEEERLKERTIHRMAPDRPVDMFDLGRKYTFLKTVLDAEYGSATFVAADKIGTWELRVSTTGLLLREKKPD